MAKWVEGTVVGQRQWTDRLFSLQVDAEVGAFEPGQWTKLALPVAGEFVARAYSFVNAPKDRPHEFYYNTVPDGHLSPRLARLESMDVVFLAPAASGVFTLGEVPDAESLWLIATGTGLGPFLSMLRSDLPWQRFRQVVLVHAVRHAADLTYRQAIDSVRAQHRDRFRAVSFVSREPHPAALAGRIPEAIADERLERAAGVPLAPKTAQVMLCGNPEMVMDATDALKARGLKRHRHRDPGHVAVEPYW
jgi:ferredoxin--NADP+ reductase